MIWPSGSRLNDGVWRSPVARRLWEPKVPGSSRAARGPGRDQTADPRDERGGDSPRSSIPATPSLRELLPQPRIPYFLLRPRLGKTDGRVQSTGCGAVR